WVQYPDAQCRQASVAVLASADAPEIEAGEQRCRESDHEHRCFGERKRHRTQMDREIGRGGLRQDFRAHRRLLRMIMAMVPIPASRLQNATQSMKRPRASPKSIDISSGLKTYIRPPTKNGRTARTTAEAFVSDESARALSRKALRARITAPRLVKI